MNKKLLILTFFIFVILGVFLFFRNTDKEIANYPPKNKTVVAFGDSLIEGVGATRGRDFVSLLGNELNIDIKNLGKSGDTTRLGLARINELLALDPGVVILLLGGNDFLRRIPKEETFSNLAQIIEKIQKNGGVVLLLGVRGGILVDEYDTQYERLAKKYKTLYVSDVLKGLLGNKDLMSDAIHPNDSGYAIIAKRVSPILKEGLPK